ncbi:hypothetical protein IWZ00DRAFT_543989 [Phyllosticta capitalensis]|uniref:Ankyrin repeat protein n=1 Tax=Phyllosticta capitalensis TaxID=121624 RepID=A0ABR1YVE2_9PEZI
MAALTIDRLLNLAPDNPAQVLALLQAHPDLASACDAHGYSLAHAAVSYSQLDLVRALVRTYNVDPNIRDEDGETPLFAAETVDAARCLVEELGADVHAKNDEGLTAEERVEQDAEFPLVSAYLRSQMGIPPATAAAAQAAAQQNGGTSSAMHPPPLPNGVTVNVGTTAEDQVPDEVVDPELKRRIDELAARDDFHTEQGQQQLRQLIEEAVSGWRGENQDRNVRMREE